MRRRQLRRLLAGWLAEWRGLDWLALLLAAVALTAIGAWDLAMSDGGGGGTGSVAIEDYSTNVKVGVEPFGAPPSSPAVGDILFASLGPWSGSPTGYAYLWLQCDPSGGSCVTAAGSPTNTSRYVIAPGDVGQTIRVQVTASYAGHPDATVRSAPTGVVGGAGLLACNLNATTSTINAQVAAATPGQVVCLASGDYSGFAGTSKAAPGIIITSAPGAAVTFTTGMDMNPSSIQNFTIDGTGGGGTMTIAGGLYIETAGDALLSKTLNVTFQNITFPAGGYVLIGGPENSNLTFTRDVFIDANGNCDPTGSGSGITYQFLTVYNTATPTTPSGINVTNSVFVAPPDLWDPRRAIQTAAPITTTGNLFVNYLARSEAMGVTGTTVGALNPAGGAWAATGTYYWVVSAILPNNETSPDYPSFNGTSKEVTANITSTSQTAPITWTAYPGAIGYRIYRSTTTNGEFTSPALVAQIAPGTSYTDTGTATTPGAARIVACTHIDSEQIFAGLASSGSGGTFSGNLCFDDYGCLLGFDGTSANTVTDNACFTMQRSCISLFADSPGSTVNHNTMQASGTGADPGGCATQPNTASCAASVVFENSHKSGNATSATEVITNNIGTQALGDPVQTTNSNNMWPGATAPNISGTPTYAGGSQPTVWSGFGLTAGSAGHNAGSDGADVGIRTGSGGPPTGGGSAPANTAAPAVTGTATQGQTLTSTAGTWTITGGIPTATLYMWYRCQTSTFSTSTCQPIQPTVPVQSENNPAYTLTSYDAGLYVYATVTVLNANGYVTALSNAKGPVT